MIRHSGARNFSPCRHGAKWWRFPGAAQHEAERNDALQTRDRYKFGGWDDPGTAAHHFVVRRIRETDL